ncbi:MAG TPA: hypothetical protein VFZ61_03930, partial [Polyangiales bacterium]
LESDGAPLPPPSIDREPLPFAFADDAPAIAPSEPPPAPASARPAARSALPSDPPPVEAAGALQSEPPTLPDPVDPFAASEPEREARRESSATLTQSQEIVLPDPVREDLASESGELRLDGEEPSSGSFELPESATVPRITPAEREPVNADRAGAALEPFDDVQDALEGSQPIMLSGPPGRGGSAFSDRDPDAEFDALLSEATDPRGIPTGARAGTSGEIDTDDLLRGLEGDELPDAEVSADELAAAHADEPHEADLLTRSLFDEDAGDSTEITDRGALLNAVVATKAADADVTLADELDADDLELVMEDEEDGATIAPPAAQQSSKAPPPPPPPGADKRPSLLGRLFNKREPGSE